MNTPPALGIETLQNLERQHAIESESSIPLSIRESYYAACRRLVRKDLAEGHVRAWLSRFNVDYRMNEQGEYCTIVFRLRKAGKSKWGNPHKNIFAAIREFSSENKIPLWSGFDDDEKLFN